MNKNHNLVNIDVIANKIYKNPLLKDVNFEDIIDYTLSVIKILRLDDLYDQKKCKLTVQDHRAYLKDPFITIKTVDLVVPRVGLKPMVMSNSGVKYHGDKFPIGPQSYSINNKTIHTSFSSGQIAVTFTALRLDEDGLPLIVDSEALIRAVVSYIKSEVYSVLFDLGKLPEASLRRAEQDYYFEIGQASSELKGFDNDDDLESFSREYNRMFQTSDNHRNRGAATSIRENKNNF